MPNPRFFITNKIIKLGDLAKSCDAILQDEKNREIKISSVATLEEAKSGQISFFSNAKYKESFENTKSEACIVSSKYSGKFPSKTAILLSDNPYYSYALAARKLHMEEDNEKHIIDPSAFIHPLVKIPKSCRIEKNVVIEEGALIGENVKIGVGSYIGKSVKIGDNSTIAQHVSITHATIGNNVIIHSGVRIGQDGFGFAFSKGVHHKVPQLGAVVIGNDVEIGANSCIDRGAIEDTVIGDGTKIDNLVQIAHNVRIGKGCIIVAQVGISGSTILEDYVVLGGQVGVIGHLNLGSGSSVAAKSGVMSDVKKGEVVGGCPSIPIRKWHKQTAILKKLAGKNEK